MEKIFNKRNTLFLVGFVVLFKIFLSATTSLHPDEAYYWLWSKQLALGYYDHPPMVAWFIKITTLLSNSELAVRFSSIIVTIVLSILVWKFAKKLFHDDETVASASVIVLNTLPLMLVGSIIITPDTPAFVFLALAVYYQWRLIESCKTKYWYITGFFLGLSFLSKYTAILFVLSLAVYMLLDGKLKWLKNKHFYFMFVISFITFLPVIIWNSQNEWISFTFQFNHGLSGNKLHLNYVFEYLGLQSLIAGPFVFVSGIVASIYYLKSKNIAYQHKHRFLFSFSVPIIAIFIITALKSYPGANWPASAYFAFSIMVAQYLLSSESKLRRKVLLVGLAFNFVVSMLLGLHIRYAIFPVYRFSRDAAIADATNWFTGWQELGSNILHRNVKYAVTDSHQWGGVIAYYTKSKVGVVLANDRQNQFAYWSVPKDLETSKTAIIKIDNHLNENFNSIKDAEVTNVKRGGIPIRQYAIVETDGYKIKDEKIKKNSII
ncbi:MAG: glycosyltransferase family 39 protein [Endomicrobium sp.]|jgi:undecaprenyl-diphosphatase|nr:glycosyltransferase family 39 protein [Endomicrobium sp.]